MQQLGEEHRLTLKQVGFKTLGTPTSSGEIDPYN